MGMHLVALLYVSDCARTYDHAEYRTFQRVHFVSLCAFYIGALTGALLNGFVIARFADVLVASGYAQRYPGRWTAFCCLLYILAMTYLTEQG